MISDTGGSGFDETRSFKVLSPGTAISHYKILEKIGEGGMGVVYKAEDTRLDRTVALKFLPPRLLCDAEARERFEHEAKAASALNHPNIATIHEIDEVEGRCFIAMEYLEGGSLKGLPKSKDLSITDILDLALQIGEGLSAAHESGVVHRDIKPDNIMLTGKGRPKIMDFGLAKLKGTTKVTKTGTTLGTLQYMSPEQAGGREVDRRSDIFSFGVILYEMVAGRLPFQGETEAAIINAIINDTPEPMARYKADVSQNLQRIVDKALAKNKSERYQHVDDLLADLRHERRLSERIDGVWAGRERTASRLRSRLTRLVGLAAIAGIILVVYWILEPFRIEMGPKEEVSAQENSLAIMYFENMVDPEDSDKTAQMITALLITDLSESDYVYVISRQRLYDILKLLGKEDLKVIDRTVASDIAERAGVKWILTGSILKIEPNIVLTSDISDATTGRIMATQRIAGEAGEDLFEVADRLSASVKRDLELPDAARNELDRPVADVTTHSPEAYRYYLDGIDYDERLYRIQAIGSFKKAIEYDSTFAMAYWRLSAYHPNVEGQRLAAKAMEYVDNASDRDRYLIEAVHAAFSGDAARGTEILSEAARRYPDDKIIRFELALFYGNELDQLDKSIDQLEAAVEIDPMFRTAYNQLAYTYDAVGDFDKSIWAINKYISLAPGEPNPYDSRGDLYAYNGKIENAIASFEAALEIDPDFLDSVRKLGHMHLFLGEYEKAEGYYKRVATSADLETRSRGRLCLALIPAHRGRFGEALAVLDDGIAADRIDQYAGLYRALKHRLKAELHLIGGEHKRATAEARQWTDLVAEFNIYLRLISRPYFILTLAESGEFEEAERVSRELGSELLEAKSTDLEWKWIAAAFISMARGDAPAAVSSFEKARDIDPVLPSHIRVMLAQAYLESGRLADAVAELDKMLKRFDDARATTPTYSVRAHYLAGLAYEQSGWNDRAVEQYEEFLEIWKDADPGIAEIEDARQRLARLKRSA
jgi:tetratricopeptide (TPR) repeat protein/predicted Ser/Thr protein kinase